MSTITQIQAGQAVVLDRAAAYRRAYAEQFEAVRASVQPNIDGTHYSGKQIDYIRSETSRRALAVVDRAFFGARVMNRQEIKQRAIRRVQLDAQERHIRLENKRIQRLEAELLAEYIAEIEAFLSSEVASA